MKKTLFLTEILTQTQTNYLNFEIMTNELEKTIIKKLEATVQSYTALSLRPGIGNKTIQREGNRLLINEGRGGIFENVSEAFYDELVEIYDWRVNREKRFL